ncbi:MAG: GtrA family protein [Gammaproteobacteria bacterium]|nr:GtrA family protein [Gammaproteobacteria bacterium]
MGLEQIFARILGESEFNKYIVAGFTAFLVDFSVLLIATEWFGIHYLVSNIFSYTSGLLVAYTLNIRWVFRYRKYKHTTKKEFSIFVLIVLIGLAISEAAIFLLVEQVALPYHYAKIVSVGAIFVFNFIAKKHFLFTEDEG